MKQINNQDDFEKICMKTSFCFVGFFDSVAKFYKLLDSLKFFFYLFSLIRIVKSLEANWRSWNWLRTNMLIDQ